MANRVAEGQMNDFVEVKADVEKYIQKTNKCPMDGAPLIAQSGDGMPENVAAFKCTHCGWWWFPGGNLVQFKKAYDAKKNYLSFWKKKGQEMLVALPVLMTLVLMVGLGIGVSNIAKQQNARVSAGTQTHGFVATYQGGGRAEVRFLSDKVLQYVMFKQIEDEVWGPVEVKIEGEGKYLISLQGLIEDKVYQMQVDGQRFYFVAE